MKSVPANQKAPSGAASVAVPGREQWLAMSVTSKLLMDAQGRLIHQTRNQSKVGRTPLIRLAMVDVDSRTLYAELFRDEESLDIEGFIGRAWSPKKNHPMRGVPSQIALTVRLQDEPFLQRIKAMQAQVSFKIVEQYIDFGTVTPLLQRFERTFTAGIEFEETLPFFAINSSLASELSDAQWQAWESVPLPPPSLTKYLDGRSEPPIWRERPYSHFLQIE